MRSLTALTGPHLTSPVAPAAGESSLHFSAGGPIIQTADTVLLRPSLFQSGVMPANVANTTTTMTDMTGLGMAVEAGGVYFFEFTGTYTCSGSNGANCATGSRTRLRLPPSRR